MARMYTIYKGNHLSKAQVIFPAKISMVTTARKYEALLTAYLGGRGRLSYETIGCQGPQTMPELRPYFDQN